MAMVKKEIRSFYIDKRNELSADELKDMTERIVNNFRTVALQGTQVLLSYYPIPERKNLMCLFAKNCLHWKMKVCRLPGQSFCLIM